MNIHQQKSLAQLTKDDQFLYTMMMIDTNDKTIPPVQTPPWVTDLGHDLKRLVENRTIKRLWFDSNEVIQVELKN